MKKVILFSLIILVFSCTPSGNDKTTDQNSTAIETKTGKKPEIDQDASTEYDQSSSHKVIKFDILEKPVNDLSSLKYDGEIVFQKFWQDANGENVVFLTKSKEELFAYHYSMIQGNAKLLRKVYDFEKDCKYDLSLDFIESSISVTDLDENNLGEITFAYRKACISDVSPKQLKLLMLENGNKYIIRGTTSIDIPGIKIAGSKNVDPSFTKAPAEFISYANEIWDKIQKE